MEHILSYKCSHRFNIDTVFNLTGKEQVSELDVPEILHQNPLTQENSDDQYLRFASSPNSDNGTNIRIVIKLLCWFLLLILAFYYPW